MVIEEFIERVRIGVISGIFSVKDAIDYMNKNGWATTRDVPDDRRENMLWDLSN